MLGKFIIVFLIIMMDISLGQSIIKSLKKGKTDFIMDDLNLISADKRTQPSIFSFLLGLHALIILFSIVMILFIIFF